MSAITDLALTAIGSAAFGPMLGPPKRSLIPGPKTFSETKTWTDLTGGNEDFGLGPGKIRGVFAKYPATTRKFDPNPAHVQTMARLAIPVPNPQKFITDNQLNATLGDLASKVIIQGNSTASGLGYIDFLLQNVSETFSEKVQISDTIGDNYVAFFFGAAPPTFSFSGQFLNTFQDDWRMAFHILYQKLLRGTRLARYNQLVTLNYDNITVSGYLLNHMQNFSAEMQMASSFSFQLLVKSILFQRLPGTQATITTPASSAKLGEGASPLPTIPGLTLAPVSRSTRVVGAPELASDNRNGEQASSTPKMAISSDNTESQLRKFETDPAVSQIATNIRNPPQYKIQGL